MVNEISQRMRARPQNRLANTSTAFVTTKAPRHTAYCKPVGYDIYSQLFDAPNQRNDDPLISRLEIIALLQQHGKSIFGQAGSTGRRATVQTGSVSANDTYIGS